MKQLIFTFTHLHIFSLMIIFLFIVNSTITGQNVTINGQAKGAEGKTIFLIGYSDQITFTEKKIASAKIDISGKFMLNANINEVIQAFLKIDNYKTELYIEPGKQFDINIVAESAIPANSKANPYLNLSNFSLEILNAQEHDLNVVLPKFNSMYNDFVLNNFDKLFRSRHRTILDSFKIKIDSTFKDIKNKYFKDYVYYKTGALEFMSRLKSNTEIEKKYFYNNPILYENPEYMEFFNEFYSKYFTNSKYMNLEQINSSINVNNGDFEQLLQLIKRDTLIVDSLSLIINRELRTTNYKQRTTIFGEMVLLKELNELYHTKGYNKNNILYMIKDAEIKLNDSYSKQVAGNLYKLLTKLQPGTKAPDFKLTDSKGNKLSLNNFKGKYIYVNFWKSNIKSCLAELQIISTIYEKYKNRIEFISICVDPEERTMTNYLLENKNYKWTFAYFNDDWDLLNQYDVQIYPAFVFIDDEGNINTYPAPIPSEQIQNLFDKSKR